VEAVTLLQWAFDTVLGFALLWLAWRVLASPDLFRAIVLFIAFGLLMALAWVRLDATDVALAEAAIGAGLTGALLLAALARLESKNKTKAPIKKTLNPKFMTEGVKKRTPFLLLLMVLLSAMAVGLGYAVLSLPSQAPGLSEWVTENLKNSGVSNPVTAVLLNFRGYDTLLEMGVVLLALLGVWSFGGKPAQRESSPGLVLDMLPRLLVPVLILVAGYLLWVGAHAPGGAFQAGSVLGAAGVLLLLAGWRLSARLAGLPLRITLVTGLGMFVVVSLVLILLGGRLLEYPPPLAGALILLIEAAATLSIGITLAALFLGGRPEPGPHQ
jgi:multisubunit Na+/H+ antiporter MnhB subunit